MSSSRNRPSQARRSTADSSSSDNPTIRATATPSPPAQETNSPISPDGDYFDLKRRRGSSSATATAYDTGAFGPPSSRRQEDRDIITDHIAEDDMQQGLIPDDSYGTHLDESEEMGGEDGGEERDEDEDPVQGLDEDLDLSGAADGDEFGDFEQADRDDASDRTPSTTSNTSQTPLGRPKAAYPSLSNSSPSKRSPYLPHAVSRLRSHARHPSTSTIATNLAPSPSGMSEASHFSAISRSSSYGVLPLNARQAPAPPSSVGSGVEAPRKHSAGTVESGVIPSSSSPSFVLHTLRNATAQVYPHALPRKATTLLGQVLNEEQRMRFGRPVVMAVNGMIAVGTEGGWVVVLGFGQEVKCICGTDAISKDAGAVTALTISPDQTYIAVGHARGSIFLYELRTPSKPARSAIALSLQAIQSGRKEGHLEGTRILHVDFVGIRHTAIISGDEDGRAFWWSLGKVLGVESSDVVRMLGSNPDKPKPSDGSTNGSHSPNGVAPRKRGTTLLAATPLPIGTRSHPTDVFSLTALLTPSKLLIVGLKPTPRTWYRKLRVAEGGVVGDMSGCAVWLKSGSVRKDEQEETAQGDDVDNAVSDPVLVYSWGNVLRFLRVRASITTPAIAGRGSLRLGTEKSPSAASLEFLQGKEWKEEQRIMALEWLNPNHLLVVTATHLSLLDVRSMKRVEYTDLDALTRLVSQPYVGRPAFKAGHKSGSEIIRGSIGSYKGKIFLLTRDELKVGSLMLWADRILALCHVGDFLAAIRLAVAYYEDRAPGNTIGLPTAPTHRKHIVGDRIRSLIRSSLQYVFSEDRMTDGTYDTPEGTGVDLTFLFEDLATTTLDACISTGDLDYAFDEVYEQYKQVGITGIYLSKLQAFLLDGKLKAIPPNVIQALISHFEDKGQYRDAETIIWHVEPSSLDINQAIRLCERHELWDALIYVYNRCLHDYVTPMSKLLGLIRQVQQQRTARPAIIGVEENGWAHMDRGEELVPDAYKLYAYVETILSGCSYPSGDTLGEIQSVQARVDVYSFLFNSQYSGQDGGVEDNTWEYKDPATMLSYPHLRTVLSFDSEAFLHSMDIAFEDSYLNDTSRGRLVSRQLIVNIMLDLVDGEDFSTSDQTFVHIFVARNLPKYPQFLSIPPSILHSILVKLSTDPDQSTREDRELAAEFLLSAYTPHDADIMYELFDQAGFYRILRAVYKREANWTALIPTYTKDPELSTDVFAHLDEIFESSGSTQSDASAEIETAVRTAVPVLLELSIPLTATFLDRRLPSLHEEVLELLDSTPHKRAAYLRRLLQPEQTERQYETNDYQPATSLPLTARTLYVSLIAETDPATVVPFLDSKGPEFFNLADIIKACDEHGPSEAVLWALNGQGKVREAFDKASSFMQRDGLSLAKLVLAASDSPPDEDEMDIALADIRNVCQMGIRICQDQQSTGSAQDYPAEDMWFSLLIGMVDVVQSLAAVESSPSDKVDSDEKDLQSSSAKPTRVLRSLIQDTLTSLVSHPSNVLSFPRLFKRLVESTNHTTTSAKGRAYAEFRIILTGMLESYKSEGYMLSLATRLIGADLFDALEVLNREQSIGWGPTTGMCPSCEKPLLSFEGRKQKGRKGTTYEVPEESIVVFRSGVALHAHCTNGSVTEL